MREERIDSEHYMPEDLLTEVRKRHQEECREELTSLHITNFLWNMSVFHRYPGILGFEQIFKRVPAVIVGAGPSLDKHLSLLERYRKNIIIVAGDATLPIFKERGFYPHFCVMVDPTEKQKDNFVGVDTTKFITVVPPIVHPSIFRMVDPHHLCMYNVKDPKSVILEQAPYHTGRLGALPAGVLTSGSCFGFAAAMGCDPILFIGHDLSWPTPDKVYAEGVVKEKIGFQKGCKFRSGCLLFPDIHGKLVLTHTTFVNFWAWLRDCVRVVDVRVINCTEAGILKFRGMRVMRFESALKRYASKELVGVEEKINKAYNYKVADGLIEKLLLPKMRKRKEVR